MNHQIVNPAFDARHLSDVSVEAAETYIRAAQRRMGDDRAAGMASLDDMFRAGRPPHNMNGRYRGEMLAVDLAPGLTHYAAFVQHRFRPWRGKVFDSQKERGDNVFADNAGPWFRVLLPSYRGRRPDTNHTFRAFDFRTYVAPGLFDPDLSVLKIDYDLPENPARIRGVLDELVELADGYYLGRAYLRGRSGWRRVAHFSLRMSSD